MPSSAYVETVLRESPRLIERRYERTGKIVHRSEAYAGGRQEVVTFQGMTRTEAKAAHVQHQEDFNGKATGGKTVTDAPRTLAEAVMRVMDALDEEAQEGERSPDSARNYRVAAERRILVHPIASCKLTNLDDEICTAWLRWLKREGIKSDLSSWTLHGTVTVMQKTLRVARQRKWMKHDPFAAVERKHFPVQKTRSKTVALSNEQGLALVAAAQSVAYRKLTDTDYSNIITVARFTPGRPSEVCGLHWRDWDSKTGRLAVAGAMSPSQKVAGPVIYKEPKNGDSGKRNPPVFPECRTALVRQREVEFAKGKGKPDDLIFTKANGQPITRHDLRNAVQRAAKLAGLEPITARQLRTSWITAAAHAGMPSVEISTHSGNSPAVIERFYVQPIRTEEQQQKNIGQMKDYGFAGAAI